MVEVNNLTDRNLINTYHWQPHSLIVVDHIGQQLGCRSNWYSFFVAKLVYSTRQRFITCFRSSHTFADNFLASKELLTLYKLHVTYCSTNIKTVMEAIILFTHKIPVLTTFAQFSDFIRSRQVCMFTLAVQLPNSSNKPASIKINEIPSIRKIKYADSCITYLQHDCVNIA